LSIDDCHGASSYRLVLTRSSERQLCLLGIKQFSYHQKSILHEGRDLDFAKWTHWHIVTRSKHHWERNFNAKAYQQEDRRQGCRKKMNSTMPQYQ